MKKILLFSDDVQRVFENDETLLKFSKLLSDTALNNVKEYSKEEANEVIRAKFHEVLGTSDNSTRRELRKAIRRHKTDLFDIIEETLDDLLVSGWGNNPFFMEYVEMKNMNAGDTNEFYVEDDSVLTVSELSGNHHSLIRQRLGAGRKFGVTTSWYGIKIYAEYELFMAQKVDWAGFIQKIYEAFDRKVNSMIYASLMAAGEDLPANAQFNKTSALTAETKETFIELVEDVRTATGHDVVVLGTRAALSKLTSLTPIEWITDSMKKERQTTGSVGLWEGIKLVNIPQVFEKGDTTAKLIDNNKLLIMPVADNKFIKFFNEGDAQIAESTDGSNIDKTIEYEFQQKMGVATVINMIFGVWTVV